MILQHNEEMFEYRESVSGNNLFCFSLPELITQVAIIYKKNLLTILN